MSASTAADLVADLERRIIAGELRPGERLDPVRTAAQRLGLAPNTVAAAYRTLAERCLVVGRGRRGTFVEESRRPLTDLVPPVPPGLVDLASGGPDPAFLPDLAPFLSALEGSTTTYGDPSVAPDLESAARMALATDGVESELLAVTGGAVDGVERALEGSLRPGDAVAVEDPGWFAIVDLVRAMGLVAVPVPVDDDGMLPDRLAEVAGRLAAVILTPRAHNPTGAAFSPERANELVGVLAPWPGVLVIEDDHMGPVAGPPLAAVASRLERWAHVRSFSKAFGPDLRTAVVAGDTLTLDRLLSRQLVGPGWVSHILQRTAALLLGSVEVAELQAAATRAYGDRRGLMSQSLERYGLTARGRSGVNMWVPVADEEVAMRAGRERGYALRAGSRFRHRSGPGVRITISNMTTEIADDLAEALGAKSSGRMSRLV